MIIEEFPPSLHVGPMGDNTIYKRGEGETTEWDDLMVKHGHKEAPQPVWKAEAFVPAVEGAPKNIQWLDKQSEDDLERLDDEFADDRVLEEIRCSTYRSDNSNRWFSYCLRESATWKPVPKNNWSIQNCFELRLPFF